MVVNGDMAERFTLLDETIFDNEKQAEDGGRVTYWVVSYGQRQRLVGLLNNLHQENQQLKHYKLYEDNKRLQTIIADLKEENEQLQTQLAIFQQSNDDGRFQVWEVPPIPKGTRITFSTTERSGKNK